MKKLLTKKLYNDAEDEDDSLQFSEMAVKFAEAKKSMKTGKLTRGNIIDMIDFIVRRKNIKPGNMAIFKNFLLVKVPCCRRNCLLRTKKDRKEQRILKRGFDRVAKSFDVSNLVKSSSLSKLMMSALLSKEQKLLLLFQRRNVIEDRPSEHVSSNTGSSEDMARQFHANLSSEAPLDRIFALGKVATILKRYEKNSLNAIDNKLVQGFFNRSLRDYHYLERIQSFAERQRQPKDAQVKNRVSKTINPTVVKSQIVD